MRIFISVSLALFIPICILLLIGAALPQIAPKRLPIEEVIPATCIKWVDEYDEPSKPRKWKPWGYEYHPTSKDKLSNNNNGHSGFRYLKGKFKHDCDTLLNTVKAFAKVGNDIYLSWPYKISVGDDGQPIIGPGAIVAPPCPPYCSDLYD